MTLRRFMFSSRRPVSCSCSDSRRNFFRILDRFACYRFRSRRSIRCVSVMAQESGRRLRFFVVWFPVLTVARPLPPSMAAMPAKPDGLRRCFGGLAEEEDDEDLAEDDEEEKDEDGDGDGDEDEWVGPAERPLERVGGAMVAEDSRE